MDNSGVFVVFGVLLTLSLFQMGLLLRASVIMERIVTHLTDHHR